MENIAKMITIEDLDQFEGQVHTAIEWAKEQRGKYPQKPKKPLLKSTSPSIEEINQYTSNNEKYLRELSEYEKVCEDYKKRDKIIDEVITEYIKRESSLNIVPKEYRDKVYSKAWEMGHSDGYYSVYCKLVDLIEIFE